MNRGELTAQVAQRAGVNGDTARAAIDALFGTVAAPGLIAGALARGERVQLPGFGMFEVRQRKARLGLDPRTRTRIAIPAGAAPVFRAGAGLRQQVRSAADLRDAAPGL
jgi:DNA-binding protein HU-beta